MMDGWGVRVPPPTRTIVRLAEKARPLGRPMAAASVIVAKEFGEHAQERDLVDALLILIHRRTSA